MIDRVNVGGNESGQQSGYVGNGSTQTNAIWSLDGVVITDIAAVGVVAAPTTTSTPSRRCRSRPAARTPRRAPAAWASTWSPSAAPTSGAAAVSGYIAADKTGRATSILPSELEGDPGLQGQATFKAGPRRSSDRGLRGRARRADRQGQAVDLGLVRREPGSTLLTARRPGTRPCSRTTTPSSTGRSPRRTGDVLFSANDKIKLGRNAGLDAEPPETSLEPGRLLGDSWPDGS